MLEQEIKAAGADQHPRIAQADIDNAIVGEYYFTGAQAMESQGVIVGDRSPLHLITFCVLELRNGFTVTGQSAVVSRENFRADIGQKVARANAIQEMWPLMGYALKDRLFLKQAAEPVMEQPL